MGICSSTTPVQLQTVENPSVSGSSSKSKSKQSAQSLTISVGKAPPASILAKNKKNKEPRPTASKYIASSNSNNSPPASPPHGPSPVIEGVAGSSSIPIINVEDTSTTTPFIGGMSAPPSPAAGVEFVRASSSPTNKKRKSRRSSDGRRVLAEANANGALTLPPPAIAMTHSHSRGNSGNGPPEMLRKASSTTRHHSGRRHTKRRTSNNGMISRLALQFPLIRTSFFAVYRAFEKFMAISAQADEEVKRKSLQPGQSIIITSASHQPRPLLKTNTDSNLYGAPFSQTRGDIHLSEDCTVQEEVTEITPMTEAEARKAELKVILAASEAPLLPAPPPVAQVVNQTVNSNISSLKVRELGAISPEKLGEAIQAISGGMGDGQIVLSNQEIQQLFKLSDLLGGSNKSITFREFLVAMAIGYFLKDDIEKAEAERLARKELLSSTSQLAVTTAIPVKQPSPRRTPSISAPKAQQDPLPPSPRIIDLNTSTDNNFLQPIASATTTNTTSLPTLTVPSATSSSSSSAAVSASLGPFQPQPPHFAEVQKGFRVVFQAFTDMDEDHSGDVSISELKRALFAASNLKNDNIVLEQRFKELDLDSSGQINLPEFLYGVVSWVGLMDEDDADEISQR